MSGKVLRTEPRTNVSAPRQETAAQKITRWGLNFIRNSVTLILIGLLLLWLFPIFMRGLSDQLQTKPLPSLGWGAVAWAAFFFALLLIVVVTAIAGLLFGVLSLGQLTGTVIGLGFLTVLGLIVGFVLVTTFVAKVVFGLRPWEMDLYTSPFAAGRT